MSVADPVQQAILAVMKLTLSQLDPAKRYLRADHTCCIETALRLRRGIKEKEAKAENTGDAEEGEAARGGGNDTDKLSSCSDADDDQVDVDIDVGDMRNSYLHQKNPTQSLRSKYKSTVNIDTNIPPSSSHVAFIHSPFGQGAIGSVGDGFGRLSCHQDSTIQGWVYKKSDWRDGSTFKSRWMTLTKDAGDWHLNYYLDNDDMRTPQGSLCCTGLKIEEDAGLSGKLYCFAITPTQGACQRRRVCACDTEEQRTMW